jgi:hypothetical protein
MAIFSSGGQRSTVTLPVDALVTLSEEARGGDRLIGVVWNEKDYLMFAQDLRDRAERVGRDATNPA